MLVNLTKKQISLLLTALSNSDPMQQQQQTLFNQLSGVLESCECQAQKDSDSDYAKSVDHLVNSMEQSK